MADLPSEWALDAVEILGEIPKQVTVQIGSNGTPKAFAALLTPPSVMQDIETGGFVNHASFDGKFLKTDVTANPTYFVYGNIMNYNGSQYRIMTVIDRPPSAWYIVKVQTLTQ